MLSGCCTHWRLQAGLRAGLGSRQQARTWHALPLPVCLSQPLHDHDHLLLCDPIRCMHGCHAWLQSVKPDFSNYDESAAWPYLLDEFVEHVKEGSSMAS